MKHSYVLITADGQEGSIRALSRESAIALFNRQLECSFERRGRPRGQVQIGGAWIDRAALLRAVDARHMDGCCTGRRDPIAALADLYGEG